MLATCPPLRLGTTCHAISSSKVTTSRIPGRYEGEAASSRPPCSRSGLANANATLG
jgi:hypothetical protein